MWFKRESFFYSQGKWNEILQSFSELNALFYKRKKQGPMLSSFRATPPQILILILN
jgi:hypothetical protein